MLSAIVLAASMGAADVPKTENHLQALDFLVGSCWAGDFPGGRGVDTHCFSSVYGGKFVRDTHVLHGKGPDYAGESIYGWDPAKQHIVFWYWSSDGDIEQGTANPSPEGLDFPEHHLTEPQDLTFRTHWRRIDADHYQAVNERKDGDAWKTEWKIDYHRTKAHK
jgi:hypothetical protein